MCANLRKFPFEARRDVSKLIVSLIFFRDGDTQPGVEYVQGNLGVLDAMVQGYDSDAANVSLICGSMLRDLSKQPAIAEQMLHSPSFLGLFDHLLSPNFDVASDAFDTFKALLTNTANKHIAAQFFEESYDLFFGACHKVLRSDHFFSRLQLIKLLGELLFDRSNFHVMKRYIAAAEHLKLVMQLLKDDSNKIACEALNVFKIFVANPEKAPEVREILFKNRDKLLLFLHKFQADEANNQQFMQERQQVIDAISKME
eukprot:TRINITY_DN1452_c0_g1_i3.p2 TRINITY_DN1452_c0_g1~~TRINITY_DN1452_c0_g1_i3.p2  ORF type:complete len:257 (-),score=98.96 TRINITY_DN1452_c0_g1_i3:1709-2479(-)